MLLRRRVAYANNKVVDEFGNTINVCVMDTATYGSTMSIYYEYETYSFQDDGTTYSGRVPAEGPDYITPAEVRASTQWSR